MPKAHDQAVVLSIDYQCGSLSLVIYLRKFSQFQLMKGVIYSKFNLGFIRKENSRI